MLLKVMLMKFLFYIIGNNLPISYKPLGKFGKLFRYFCAKHFLEYVGKNVNIEKGAVLSNNIKIGDNSGIGVNAFISPHVTIGINVMMGSDCLFYTNNHKFDKDKKIYNNYTEYKPIIIEDNVWIGSRCIILPGVTIGKGSTIGAGSVVTKNVPAYTLAAGNPAKVLKQLLD